MNKQYILLLALLCINLLGCENSNNEYYSTKAIGDTTIVTTFYDNGHIKYIDKYINDTILVGYSYSFYKDGSLKGKYYYKNGKRYGKGFGYYKNGKYEQYGVADYFGTIFCVIQYDSVGNFESHCGSLFARDYIIDKTPDSMRVGKPFQFWIFTCTPPNMKCAIRIKNIKSPEGIIDTSFKSVSIESFILKLDRNCKAAGHYEELLTGELFNQTNELISKDTILIKYDILP